MNLSYSELAVLAAALDSPKLLSESRSLIEALVAAHKRVDQARAAIERARVVAARVRAFTRLLDWVELITPQLAPHELEQHLIYVRARLDRELSPSARVLERDYIEELGNRSVMKISPVPLSPDHPAALLARGVVFSVDRGDERAALRYVLDRFKRPHHLFEHVVCDCRGVSPRHLHRVMRLESACVFSSRSVELRGAPLAISGRVNVIFNDLPVTQLHLVDCVRYDPRSSLRLGADLLLADQDLFVLGDRLRVLRVDSPALFPVDDPGWLFRTLSSQLLAKLVDTIELVYDPSFTEQQIALNLIAAAHCFERADRVKLVGPWPERSRRFAREFADE